MGKHRKQRNGVDQVQTFAIETENPNQEIPEDFLTSDDFCIVQKKKNNKKFIDNLDFNTVYRSQTSLGKDEDSSKCHTSFWTCNIGEFLNENSVASTSNNLELQSSDGQQDSISENPEFHAELEFTNAVLSSETSIANNENQLSNNVESENTIFTITHNKSLEISSLFDKSVTSKSICCSKKKNKRKEPKKKSVDEDIEKILRELDIEDKFESKTIASTGSSDKSCLLLNSKKCNDIVDEACNSFDGKEKTTELNAVGRKSKKDTSEDLSITKIKGENICREESAEIKSTVNVKGDNHVAKKSEKKKESKAKSKSISENVRLEDRDSCQNNSSELSKFQDSVSNESGFNSYQEEKIPKSKSFGEADKRGKKRPGKKQLAMIREALRKAKEEEERLKKEEEFKQKMAEEAEKIRQEKLRQEQEKKEKKKLKEKQRREKMKAEGRLLSKSQKQSRARMEATLAALRQQGIEVPYIGAKKSSDSHGPRLGNCKNFHRKRYDSCQSTHSCDSAIFVSDRQKSESCSSQESSGKESLSDLPNGLDSASELGTTPESDRGIFSYSEESDDTICASKKKRDQKTTKKHQQNKTETILANEVQPLENDYNINRVKYRSPIVCVLGHVDTGKTKLLDYIRKTHVQDSEAGGITQQIGATMIPQDALKEKCKMVKNISSFKMEIPGLLVIDTPGHESFSNLRSRGSSICDIAILVVDIMHGLEPQTIESINLLKKGKTPFIVALNKVDRIYGWKSSKDEDIEMTIKNQNQTTQSEFKKLCEHIVLQFANHCLNVALFYENKDPRSYISMVPASAITGDGMGNVLSTVAQLTQALMKKKLIYSNELEGTVLEVKAIPGLGTTIDVILVNGCLQEGDTIILAGQEGPIVTQIRSLLMPQPLKELRVKNPYIEYKAIEGAQGVKITGKDLEKSLAGLPLFVASNHNMIENLKAEVNNLVRYTVNLIKTSERGVYVQASTLGSLEALLEFLSASGVPYFNVKIGPVVKKDVMKASIMLEHDIIYAAILAFDVKIERDAQELADSLGVQIFHADIIYHLFDMYTKFRDDLLLKQSEEVKRLAVFPCKLKILSDFVLSPRDPIVLGVLVEQGSLREGTPLCVTSRDILEIGVVSSIEMNSIKINCAKKGDEVCIKIEPRPGESAKTYGRHFSHEDLLVSRISRQSIDVCKEHFRNELQPCDWHLIVELKKMLHIM